MEHGYCIDGALGDDVCLDDDVLVFAVRSCGG